jgi:hypothetical protein
MKKIASPAELQSELRRLIALASEGRPSREKLASEIRKVASRVVVGRSVRTLDLRELAEEKSDLEAQLEAVREDDPEAKLDKADMDRLKELTDLEGELGDLEMKARDEPTLIHDADFEDYARQFHEDINGKGVTGWPYDYIDWKAAAEALQQDYSSVDFDGDTWWYHS